MAHGPCYTPHSFFKWKTLSVLINNCQPAPTPLVLGKGLDFVPLSFLLKTPMFYNSSKHDSMNEELANRQTSKTTWRNGRVRWHGGSFSGHVCNLLLIPIFTSNLEISVKFSDGGEAYGCHKKQKMTNNSEGRRARLSNFNCLVTSVQKHLYISKPSCSSRKVGVSEGTISKEDPADEQHNPKGHAPNGKGCSNF